MRMTKADDRPTGLDDVGGWIRGTEETGTELRGVASLDNGHTNIPEGREPKKGSSRRPICIYKIFGVGVSFDPKRLA